MRKNYANFISKLIPCSIDCWYLVLLNLYSAAGLPLPFFAISLVSSKKSKLKIFFLKFLRSIFF